ncbi:hypothetical protein BC834DRAFT_844901 [Gloeopeniophorella convolvens]|nr:hypothetical protein BC834DRAFT_844901 [Gloeopeniophorella convolvens]
MDSEADLLATKWISPIEFAREYGIVCRTGPFTREEVQCAEEEIERHRLENNLSKEEIAKVILEYDHRTSSGFWPVSRGKWRPSEDDVLRRSVVKLGTNWVAVAQEVERPAQDCRDRWQRRLKAATPGKRSRNPWSPQHEKDLLRVMRELGKEGPIDTKQHGFWVGVSNRMGGTRTADQCQVKWTRSLGPMLRKRVWGAEDNRALVAKVAPLNVASEDDLDWSSIRDAGWAHWSADEVQEKWSLLKSELDSSGLSHREVVALLVAGLALSELSLPRPGFPLAAGQ